MLTTPITTPHFHSRVLTLLSNHLNELNTQPNSNIHTPTIPSLSSVDTPLSPNEIVSQLIAVASPWIDLSSPDPLLYNISRQVLELEVAYAAFCGVGNIILPSPRLHHGGLHGDGITQYAYAVQEALNVGPYISFSVSLPMMDIPEEEEDDDPSSLVAQVRRKYLGLEYEDGSDEEIEGAAGNIASKKSWKFDYYGTWDAWNVIRTICKYNSRLFVGKKYITHPLNFSFSC